MVRLLAGAQEKLLARGWPDDRAKLVRLLTGLLDEGFAGAPTGVVRMNR
jgi:hypothetical protein